MYDQTIKLESFNLPYNNYRWFSRPVHSLGSLPRCHFQKLIKSPKIKSFSRAGYCTGGLSAYLYTEIALLHDAVVTKLWHTIRACREAVLATIALIPINHDDAILSPLADSSSGAHCSTGRLITVHTGQGEKSSGNVGILTTPGLNDSPPFYSRFGITSVLTRHFTGATLNTPARIIVETILF